jgi:hypothetical protein
VTQGFGLDWLRLREVADRRSRSRALARRFAAAVRARAGGGTALLLDLGAGTGANFRVLAPLIACDQDWRLIDRDPALIAHQPTEIAQWGRAQGYRVAHGSGLASISVGGAEWRVHSTGLDLTDLDGLPLMGVHGVTCSALLDLVSNDWLAALARRLASGYLPFLAALSTDGRREWRPPHQADVVIARAFAGHHRRDKGFGPALSDDAPAVMAAIFESLGYAVSREPSDWRLGAESNAVLELLIEETAAAAGEVEPAAAATIANWRRARLAERGRGELRLLVGHADLVAIPNVA